MQQKAKKLLLTAVIVIAALAVLAAVLIPMIPGWIDRANASKDVRTVQELNAVLAAAETTPASVNELIDVLGLSGAELEETLTPARIGHSFYWFRPANQIVCVNEAVGGFALVAPEGIENFPEDSELFPAEWSPSLRKLRTEALAGQNFSVLGDSISTRDGYSNDPDTNSTIGNNVLYYPDRYPIEPADMWWMQAADELEMDLLVCNASSGSELSMLRGEIPGAWEDRCVQLHNDHTNEEPDIIAVAMGTNDVFRNREVGIAASMDYESLIQKADDGSYTYAEPASILDACAITLHKMRLRYPDAEVYFLTPTYTDHLLLPVYVEDLKILCSRFGVPVVDLLDSKIAPDTLDIYMGDAYIHPNEQGMDVYTEEFKESVLANTSYLLK